MKLNMPKKTGLPLPDDLAALRKSVLDAAKRNASFAAVLAADLRGIDRAASPAHASKRRRPHRRPPGVLDPFALLAEGDQAARTSLAALTVEQLKDIIAEHGMDSTKLAMKWRSPDRLIELLISTAKSRMRKGHVFRSHAEQPDADQLANEPPAVGRYRRTVVTLQEPAGPLRDDALQDLIEEAFAAANAAVVGTARITGSTHRSASHRAGAIAESPESPVSEELLSVGLAATKLHDRSLRNEWLRRVAALVSNQGQHPDLGAGAALATQGAAALAWHRQRFDTLGAVIDKQLESPHAWIHQDALGGSPGAFVPWAVSRLSTSVLCREADSSFAADVEMSVFVASGVAALRYLTSLPAESLAQWLSGLSDDLPGGVAWPGYYFPTARWTTHLAATLLGNPALEAAFSRAVFRWNPETLRDECRRITPALARSIHHTAAIQQRSVHWGIGSVGAGWRDWCGGTVRAKQPQD
ncbi:MAG: hypothetical protein ACYC7F_04380 [Gemmatimonadaceae bacterium]